VIELPEWKYRIWREVYNMWEAQMITLQDAEMLWAMLDKVTEEKIDRHIRKKKRALKKAA
jgi:hypothetical protein